MGAELNNPNPNQTGELESKTSCDSGEAQENSPSSALRQLKCDWPENFFTCAFQQQICGSKKATGCWTEAGFAFLVTFSPTAGQAASPAALRSAAIRVDPLPAAMCRGVVPS